MWAPRAVAQYYLRPQAKLSMTLGPGVTLASGVPIFTHNENGWTQVGHVIGTGKQPESVGANWYSSLPSSRFDFHFHHSDGSLAEAVQTLLPPDRREAIKRRIAKVSREYGPELTEAFRPIIERTLRESVPIVRDGIIRAVRSERHKSMK